VIRAALIRAAGALKSDGTNPEYDRALVELIVDATMVASEDADELRAAVEQGIQIEHEKLLGNLGGAQVDGIFGSYRAAIE
jgi:hypothetical protein